MITATSQQRASTDLPARFDEVEFVPNAAFSTMTDDEALRIPPACKLYADREAEGITDATEVGDDQTLHSLPLLTPEGEAFLFRKMNYLKYRVAQLRDGCDAKRASSMVASDMTTRLADAETVRNHLAECNLRLVCSIARRFATDQNDFDELASEGQVILLKAIDKFDFSRGFRFSTYLTHSVQRHYYRFCQQKRRRRQLEWASPSELVNELPAKQVGETERQVAGEQELLSKLIAQLDQCLDEREQLIVRERFGIGSANTARTLRDLAAEIGISKERVRQIQISAVKKLRQFFGDLQPDLASA